MRLIDVVAVLRKSREIEDAEREVAVGDQSRSFGRITDDGVHQWLPMSVEVHHGLMDGLHVGRYVQGFEAALAEPDAWLALEA